ncbi:hypothetical protein AC1031_002750 [Aphanomyces cochlioides]|nr:hypothetical protein AC1031_002750 [Aphanomyces cochlioides]
MSSLDFISNICTNKTREMQGNGAYNKAAVYQMSLVDHTTDLLHQAMARFAKNTAQKSSYCIADLGASQGRNSLELIQHILRHLDESLPDPSNDFGSLLETLNSPQSYIHSYPNVYTGAISKSFYERLVPAASVDIFVTYISTHWLSKVPTPLPGSTVFINDPERTKTLPSSTLAAWHQAAHEDLVRFLRLRAQELVDNGSLCMTAVSDMGSERSLQQLDVMTRALEDLLSRASLDRMAVGYLKRTTAEFLAALDQVPELQVHEYQHVPIDYTFGRPQDAAAFFLSIHKPSFEAGMTEKERQDPCLEEALMDCMIKRFSDALNGSSEPFYASIVCGYFYVHCSRRPRATRIP